MDFGADVDLAKLGLWAGTLGDGAALLELTYQVALAPWLVVQPDLQVFFDPAFSRRDAYALGGQAVAIF